MILSGLLERGKVKEEEETRRKEQSNSYCTERETGEKRRERQRERASEWAKVHATSGDLKQT